MSSYSVMYAARGSESRHDSDVENEYPYCEHVDVYEKITRIGQGAFGEVFKAKHRRTKQIVALKKVLMEKEHEGFPMTALREIKILQQLKHDNVVSLVEICRGTKDAHCKPTNYLVLEFCEHDLAGLLKNVDVTFSLAEIKSLMQQLLDGLFHIHSNKIMHRDLKPSNILITKTGVLKLADFGLARTFSDQDMANSYTNRVVTLWYRPPELLLGERNYGPPVDMWGVGCIIAQMWTREPIMQGTSEKHQVILISQLCGSISPDVWPAVEELDLYTKLELPKDHRRQVKEVFSIDPVALDLVDNLLTLDPSKRLDADNSLNHDFFWVDPMPCDVTKMLSKFTESMYASSPPQVSPPSRQMQAFQPAHLQPLGQRGPQACGPQSWN